MRHTINLVFVGLAANMLTFASLEAAIVTLDPDGVSSGTDVSSHFLPNATLSVQSRIGFNTTNGLPAFAFHPGTLPAGDNVFAASAGGEKFFHVASSTSSNHKRLVVVFSHLTDFIEFDVVEPDDTALIFVQLLRPNPLLPDITMQIPLASTITINRPSADVNAIIIGPLETPAPNSTGRAWIGSIRYDDPTIPEPSTFILATLGLLSLGMARRRRRR